jgi:hypothetical protein
MAAAEVVEDVSAGSHLIDMIKIFAGDCPHVWDADMEKYPPFRDYHSEFYGYDCYVCRSDLTGGWCGYVKLPKNHPVFKDKELMDSVIVYGGITGGGKYELGFDCMHPGDIWPICPEGVSTRGKIPTYKDYAFIVEETKKFAKQLNDMPWPEP